MSWVSPSGPAWGRGDVKGARTCGHASATMISGCSLKAREGKLESKLSWGEGQNGAPCNSDSCPQQSVSHPCLCCQWVRVIPPSLLGFHAPAPHPHECLVPLTLVGSGQGSRVPLPTIPSLKKVPVRLSKAEGGILHLRATQAKKHLAHKASLGSSSCGCGVHDGAETRL